MGLLIRQISEILTLAEAAAKGGRFIQESDLGIHQNYALWVERGIIRWLGPDKKIPKEIARRGQSINEISAQGSTVLPGFVECHTHSVFAGSRAHEFAQICQGVSYQEIAARGGGILSTVQATRKSPRAELVKKTQAHVNRFAKQGVTTLEIKSGYGLSLSAETKLLEVAGLMKGPRIVRTFLGAHAKSPEFSTCEEYLQFLQSQVLPKIRQKKLAERVDIFFEQGFFQGSSAERYLRAAQDLGFEVVLHADQLSLSGGSSLAIQIAASSADHLIRIEDAEIKKLAKSEVTCVLLPAADFYLRCPYPPARRLLDAGARVALATDFNPGSSPTQDLAFVGILARLEMKMSLPEVLGAYTVGAAYSLNKQKEVGSLELGKSADFQIYQCSWQELFYSVGQMSPWQSYCRGKKL